MKVSVAGQVFEASSWNQAVTDALIAKSRHYVSAEQRKRAVDALMHGREVQVGNILIKPVKEKS